MPGESGMILCAGAFVWAGLAATLGTRDDNPPLGDSVGAIEGDSISIEGPMSVEVVHGQVRTVLRSGSDVRVKAGQARIKLVEGGRFVICGPAHFSVLKSGGALTLALESGIVHVHLENDLALTVYTPQIQARPISIGGGPEDVLVGLDVCGHHVHPREQRGGAHRAAVDRAERACAANRRCFVEQRTNRKLAHGTGSCACEEEMAANPGTGCDRNQQAGHAGGSEESGGGEGSRSAAGGRPRPPWKSRNLIYQVFMPPLRYDANPRCNPILIPTLFCWCAGCACGLR